MPAGSGHGDSHEPRTNRSDAAPRGDLRFVVAAETTRMAMIFMDAKAAGHPILFANDSFLALIGLGREELLGQSFDSILAQGAGPDALKAIQPLFTESPSGNDPELRYRRKDGSLFWATVLISPVRESSGEITQYFSSFKDITQHKHEAQRLRFLLDELNHRTQNTLATVLAIAKQTLRNAVDPQTLGAFEDRILALSAAQGLLGRSSWKRVGLPRLLARILEPFGLHDAANARITAQGEDVALDPKAALSLAMVFHELATNAAKHGALSVETGRVTIAWHVETGANPARLRLLWRETGGPAVAPPRRKGFGSRLIQRGLAQELNGEVRLAYEPAGVECHIAMPLQMEDALSDNE